MNNNTPSSDLNFTPSYEPIVQPDPQPKPLVSNDYDTILMCFICISTILYMIINSLPELDELYSKSNYQLLIINTIIIIIIIYSIFELNSSRKNLEDQRANLSSSIASNSGSGIFVPSLSSIGLSLLSILILMSGLSLAGLGLLGYEVKIIYDLSTESTTNSTLSTTDSTNSSLSS
jgi:hypothetical protein